MSNQESSFSHNLDADTLTLSEMTLGRQLKVIPGENDSHNNIRTKTSRKLGASDISNPILYIFGGRDIKTSLT